MMRKYETVKIDIAKYSNVFRFIIRFKVLFNLIPIVHQDFEDTTYEYIYIWQTVQSNTFQTTQNAFM